MARPRMIKEPIRLSLYLPRATRRMLAALAKQLGTSLSGVVTQLVRSRIGQNNE